jgi:sugar porter (SP) family MFS transporter
VNPLTAVGALLAGQTADRIGRKRTIQLGAAIATVGCAIQTGAVHISMLIIGRFIAGIAIGVLSMIVPVYQAEISPPHARGLLSGWTQLMIVWGFFVANWVGYGCQFLKNTGQWRIPLAIQCVPAMLLLGGMFVLPYSPRWLAGQGRIDEARATLLRLHGGASQANSDRVEAEFDEMLAQIKWEKENVATSYRDLVKDGPSRHRTLCGCLVQAMCQWTGVNVNNYFGPTIYKALGFGGNTTLLINGVSGAWQVVVVWIFIQFVVDRLGRRKPLIIGPILMSIFLAWQAGIASQFAKPGYSNQGVGIAGLVSIFLFSGAFSVSPPHESADLPELVRPRLLDLPE